MRLSLYSLVFGNHLKAKETIFGHFNKIIAFLCKFFLTSSMRTPPPKKKIDEAHTTSDEPACSDGDVLLLPVQTSSQLRLRGVELRRATHHLAIAKIPFSQKRIRRPRPWSPDTISASESRLFSPRLSRTRAI